MRAALFYHQWKEGEGGGVSFSLRQQVLDYFPQTKFPYELGWAGGDLFCAGPLTVRVL